MGANGFESMVGCASVGMRDGGHYAASLWQQLAAEYQAPRLSIACERACRCRCTPCARTCGSSHQHCCAAICAVVPSF